MRTTVTLDPDVEAQLHRVMAERGISFKEALNDAVRRGATTEGPAVEMIARRMGPPAVDLDRALQLAGALEDEELIRRMWTGQ